MACSWVRMEWNFWMYLFGGGLVMKGDGFVVTEMMTAGWGLGRAGLGRGSNRDAGEGLARTFVPSCSY